MIGSNREISHNTTLAPCGSGRRRDILLPLIQTPGTTEDTDFAQLPIRPLFADNWYSPAGADLVERQPILGGPDENCTAANAPSDKEVR